MSLKEKRVKRLRADMFLLSIDAVLIFNPENVRYLLDSNIEAALYISQSSSNNIIISDSRYRSEFSKIRASGFKKILRSGTYIDELTKVLKSKKKRVKIALESDIALPSYLKLKKISNCKFIVSDILLKLREVKDRDEIKRIEEAVNITKSSLSCLAKNIKSGMTELKIEGLLELEFKKRGAEAVAFPSIVASSPRSAMPHAKTSDKKINKNKDFLLIDSGAVFNGYCADLTRVLFWDKIPKIVKEAYGVVEEVREHVFSSLSEGVRIGEVAAKAEDLIKKRCFGSALRHSLGHGVGIQVHEMPFFNKNSEEIFKENMVLTVEPGLYFPGIGGVRVEDIVVIKKKGVKVL